MTAYFADRLLSPRGVPVATASLPMPPATHRVPIAVSAMVIGVLRAMSEWLFLLWMVTAIALFVLIAAGGAGLLS
jgi:hypothetical protein